MISVALFSICGVIYLKIFSQFCARVCCLRYRLAISTVFHDIKQGSPNFTARGPHELSSSMLRADEPYTAGQIILLFFS